jgi:predicted Zn-dependent protease with MMP-like domain
MSPHEFDQLVSEAYARIPARFRKRLKNVALIVEAEPTAAQLVRGRVTRGNTLLGLYEGRPLTQRSVFEAFAMPDKITIFQGPHERLARSDEDLPRLVADTVWHEVAHYFGMDEPQVRAAERRRLQIGRTRRRSPPQGG